MTVRESLCECASLFNAKMPDRSRCLIVCGAEVPAKHVKCHPCSLGNHTGMPCPQYVPEFPRHLIRTCKSCGFDAAVHERGSDETPNGL